MHWELLSNYMKKFGFYDWICEAEQLESISLSWLTRFWGKLKKPDEFYQVFDLDFGVYYVL